MHFFQAVMFPCEIQIYANWSPFGNVNKYADYDQGLEWV